MSMLLPASRKHHAYLQDLGLGPGTIRLFDYKERNVVRKIISAVKDGGVKVHQAIEAAAGNMKHDDDEGLHPHFT